jgi:hypothetical protein
VFHPLISTIFSGCFQPFAPVHLALGARPAIRCHRHGALRQDRVHFFGPAWRRFAFLPE